jgi:DNA-binding response OmpR family regulator
MGNWDGLRAALETTIHDGATNLGDFQPQQAVGEYLLFSDGISNFGGKPFPHTQVPVCTINSSRKSDPAALRHIAERSGGRYIDLVADSRTVAAARLLNSAGRIESYSADGASNVILASRYAEHGRFVVAGVLDEPTASVRLRIVNGGELRNVTFEVGGKSPASAVAARRWAYLRAGELEREFTVNRSELERIGMRFGIVTRETSLIVLEFARDYAQYDIAPPPELKAEVEQLRHQFAQRRVQDEAQLLNRAAQLYAQRGQWWEREFPKGQKPAPVEHRPTPAVRPEARDVRPELFRGMGQGASRSLDMAGPRTAPTVYQAVNGEEGLQLASQYIPDIIISDVNMQGISGIDLCKTLKEDPALNHIPVILLTGSSSAETKLQGVEGGADDYITKPFEKELLVARVVNLLKNMNNLQKYFYNEVTLQKNPLKISTEYKEFLERCIAIVERHIDDENFNVKILASELGISHSNLYKKVKSLSGQSVNGFIRFIRLRKAAELLINTHSNVNEAAAEVGFNDTRYFRQQFSLLFGMNPSDYIKKYRKVFGKSFTLNEDGYKPEN